jgi:hypothetical protein
LIHQASFRIFIRTPAQQLGPVPEALSGKVIVPHLDDEIRLQRLPLAGALGAPAAWTAGCFAREPRCFDPRFELFEQSLSFLA